MNLNKLTIAHTGYSIVDGFFWIKFDNGKTLQCCLAKSKKSGFKRAVFKNGNGYNTGICADINAWAMDGKNQEEVSENLLQFLIKNARKSGLRII